jgi:hypothetical protein
MVSASETDLLQTVLEDMGYRTEVAKSGRGVLAESSTRVVSAIVYDGVLQLLDDWEDQQSLLLDTARDRLTVEKAWELFLVLACRTRADPDEMRVLQGIRRDPSYARKLVVADLKEMSPARLRNELAQLEELPLPSADTPRDALEILKERAEAEEASDVLIAIAAYRANRPVFEDL